MEHRIPNQLHANDAKIFNIVLSIKNNLESITQDDLDKSPLPMQICWKEAWNLSVIAINEYNGKYNE